MDPLKCFRLAFQGSILAFSVACFFMHVRGVIEKTLEGKTTVATSQKHYPSMSPPALTLCPSRVFNVVKMRRLYNKTYSPFVMFYDDESLKEENPWEVYLNSSYILNKDFSLFFNGWNFKINKEENLKLFEGENVIKDDGVLGTLTINVEEIFSLVKGLCYMISTEDKILNESFGAIFGIVISFNGPENERQDKLYGQISSKHEYTTLGYKPWPGTKPFNFEIILGKSVILSIEKTIRNYYPLNRDRPCQQQGLSYVSCLGKMINAETRKNNVGCPRVCSIPNLHGFHKFANATIDKCTGFEEAKCQDLAFFQHIMKGEKECKMLCRNEEYKSLIQTHDYSRSDNGTYVGLTYRSNIVTENEETLLYDVLTFIGSVGGSLGLFVGFSFYNLLKLMGDMVMSRLQKIEGNETRNTPTMV